MGSNDEVERRGVALSANETALSRSSIPSWLAEDDTPRSLEPIVRRVADPESGETYPHPGHSEKASSQCNHEPTGW
jgi:hypothetical protein